MERQRFKLALQEWITYKGGNPQNQFSLSYTDRWHIFMSIALGSGEVVTYTP